ncbi:MAG: CHAT domain-containing protein [Saprospiraceae bacterium]|nr:CHAT domain-containing protein [Saprospiraceae bacterium]
MNVDSTFNATSEHFARYDYPAAISTLNLLLDHFNGQDDYEVAYLLMWKAYAYDQSEDFAAMEATIQQMDTLRIQTSNPDARLFFDSREEFFLEWNYLKGTNLFNQGNYEAAKFYFGQLHTFDPEAWSFDVVLPLINAAVAMQRTGDYSKAISYLETAYPLVQTNSVKLDLIDNLVTAYIELGQFESAQKRLNQVEENGWLDGAKISDQAYFLIHAFHVEALLGHSESFEAYLKKAEAIAPKLESRELVHLKRIRAKAHQALGNPEAAEVSFEAAEKELLAPNSYFSAQHGKYAQLLLEMGKNYEAKKGYSKALSVYQKGLGVLLPNFEYKNNEEHPQDLTSTSRSFLYDLLIAKAEVLHHQENFKGALKNYELAAEVVENTIRYATFTKESTYRLLKTAKQNNESAIDLAFTTQDYKTAFYFSQKSHALYLQSNLDIHAAKIQAGVPDSLLQQERNLKLDIAAYENRSKSRQELSQNLRTAELNYDVFVNQLRADYPIYTLLQVPEKISVSAIRKRQRKNKSSYLEYFLGEKSLYIFSINSKGLSVQRQENTQALRASISQLNQAITEPWDNSTSVENSKIKFAEIAHQLYQVLIEPIQGHLKKKITIIPDDLLATLPFEVLLQSKNSLSYKTMDYLIRDYEISYSYSAQMYSNQAGLDRDEGVRSVVFAPSFTPSQNLVQLAGNQEEAEYLKTRFEAIAYTDSLATKKEFFKNMRDFEVIHLATHATVDSTQAYIAFYGDSTDYRLDLNEIYDLNLQAEMVVLSACETLKGQLQDGEGILNLSRAFSTAGSKSTIATLWSVNDIQSSKLIQGFYENLSEGMSKDEALRNAKINYIENEPIVAPYFWAAFTPTGNMQALKPAKRFPYFLMVIPLLLLALLGVFLLKKNRH